MRQLVHWGRALGRHVRHVSLCYVQCGGQKYEEGSRSSFAAQGLRKVRERDNEVRARTTLRVLLVLARTSLYNMHIIRIILRVYYILL